MVSTDSAKVQNLVPHDYIKSCTVCIYCCTAVCRILCTNDLIVLHPLGIFSFSFSLFSSKRPVFRDRTLGPTCQKVTWLPLSYRGVRIVGILNLHLDNAAVQKVLSDRMMRIKGSGEHSRWTCVDRPSCSVDEKLHNNARHRKCFRKRRLPTSACLFSLESSVALSRTVLFSNRCAAEFKYRETTVFNAL